MSRSETSAVRGPLYRVLGEDDAAVRVELDGELLEARERETVASFLLRVAGPQGYRRSPVSGKPRAPLCMMGVCFECLVEIDGQTNQQGCMVRVREGMRIRRQMSMGQGS